MEMQDKVNKVVRRKKQDDEGFSYVCQVCDFDCVGRKGIMKHFNEGHSEELDKIKSELKGEDVDAQLTKLVMNSAFVEEKSNGVPEKHKNGVFEKGIVYLLERSLPKLEEKLVKKKENLARKREKKKAVGI